jgi:hypothetical protein
MSGPCEDTCSREEHGLQVLGILVDGGDGASSHEMRASVSELSGLGQGRGQGHARASA